MNMFEEVARAMDDMMAQLKPNTNVDTSYVVTAEGHSIDVFHPNISRASTEVFLDDETNKLVFQNVVTDETLLQVPIMTWLEPGAMDLAREPMKLDDLFVKVATELHEGSASVKLLYRNPKTPVQPEQPKRRRLNIGITDFPQLSVR